jgi:hypothetical protein
MELPKQADPREYRAFERRVLRDMGLPEDKPLTEHEWYWLMVSWMED